MGLLDSMVGAVSGQTSSVLGRETLASPARGPKKAGPCWRFDGQLGWSAQGLVAASSAAAAAAPERTAPSSVAG